MDKEKTEKRPWQKPELIVLVRSNPEEAVLTGCKVTDKDKGPGLNNCTSSATHCSATFGS